MAHQSEPVYQRLRQKMSPIAAAEKRPTGDSPGFVPWIMPKLVDKISAAHQKPIPRVSVYCKYPRSSDSSKIPTKMNTTAHSRAYFQARDPASGEPSKA